MLDVQLQHTVLLMQATVDRNSMASVVNTQLVNPLTQADTAVKSSFPAVSVKDLERANVRPPNPSICVGNGFVIEVTDLVSMLLTFTRVKAGTITQTIFYK